jgi:hypothetical protein
MISHKHKFIFVHIPKTGGTSIESVFVPNAVEKDVSFKHSTAKEYQKKFNREFSEYFKFSVIRNPWDLVASLYHWMWHTDCTTNPWPSKWRSYTHTPLNWTLNEWIKSEKFMRSNPRGLSVDSPHLFKEEGQLDWISNDKDTIIVDHIMRFETLQQDFDISCNKIGLPQQILPHTNKSHHKPYWEYYDKEAQEIVGQKYHKDITMFDYTFGV